MRRAALIILVALLATACQAIKPNPEVIKTSQALYDELRHVQDAQIIAQMPPAMNTAKTMAQIAQARSTIPLGVPRGSKVVGASSVATANQGTSAALRVEYDYGDRLTLFQAQLFQAPKAQVWQVRGFHLLTATAKELSANDLTFRGKNAAQIAFFVYAIISPLLMLAALLKVILTPGLRHKWFWGLLSFVGLFTLGMNWTLGQLTVLWVSLQFIGFSIASGVSRFDPWVVKATFPLGALLILAGVWGNPVKRAKAAGRPSPTSSDSAP